jgi:RNA polymerase sigma factor (sigma-70 family)
MYLGTSEERVDSSSRPLPRHFMVKGDVAPMLEPKQRTRLVGFFRRYLQEEDANDLAQEVFIAAYQKLEHVDDQATMSWLYRTASHRLVDYLRRGARGRACVSLSALAEGSREESDLSLIDPGFKRTETADWLSQTMQIACQVCSKNQVAVIFGYYSLGSFDAVASALGLEATTVRSHFLRGRATLLAHLVQHRPDLVGGDEAIRAAIEALERDAEHGLSPAEWGAIADPDRQPKAFRSACVKIARVLGAPR